MPIRRRKRLKIVCETKFSTKFGTNRVDNYMEPTGSVHNLSILDFTKQRKFK